MSDVRSPVASRSDIAPSSATILVDAPIVTLINVLEVPAERQSELVEILEKATHEVIRRFPGFISASIHRGLDGVHVANYVQWRTMEDFERMFADPEAQVHIRAATAIAKASPFHYRVSSVHVSSN